MKKKIMAMVLAVLCITMILPVAAFADDEKEVIKEVTLSDPVDEYEVGKGAYYLGMGFQVDDIDPEEAGDFVSEDAITYVTGDGSWKIVTIYDKIKAGKTYRAVITVKINSLEEAENYCFSEDTKISYDKEKFEAAGVTLTEMDGTRTNNEIQLEVVYPELEPEYVITGFEPETVTMVKGDETTVTATFNKALPEGHNVKISTPTVVTAGEVEMASDRESCSVVIKGESAGIGEIEFQLCDSDGEAYHSKSLFVSVANAAPAIVVEGDGKWTKSTGGSLTFTADYDYEIFEDVYVDGSLLDKDCYDAKEGSTVVTLKESYLKTLDPGTYTLTMMWTDGTMASADFIVQETASTTASTVEYPIVFDSCGGSEVYGQHHAKGEKLTVPANPTKEGYTFAGWYMDKNYNQAWNFNLYTVSGPTTLYAKWTAAGGASAGTVPSTPDSNVFWPYALTGLLAIGALAAGITVKKRREN